MWHYYGGKGRLAHRYPPPAHPLIVEPFAGSAAYALLYRDRDVLLIDKDERVCALWRYLIAATADEILALPLVSAGDRVDELGLSQPAFDLIRHHAAPGARPGRLVGARSRWNERKRAEIACLVGEVKHWRVECGDYTTAPGVEATWFIDPPYQHGGHQYRHGSAGLDYTALASWIQMRCGQVIACEDSRNTWLPATREIARAKNIQNDTRTEVVWERRIMKTVDAASTASEVPHPPSFSERRVEVNQEDRNSCEAIVNTTILRACSNAAGYRCSAEHLVCGVHARRSHPVATRRCAICNMPCRGKKRAFYRGKRL